MLIKVAINGFGRIGRVFFRQAFGHPEIEIVAINDLGNLENLAYLLKYDTVYRTYDKEVKSQKSEVKSSLIVDGKGIIVLQEKDPSKLPWKDLKIDVAIESTGFFESYEAASAHLKAGAERVIISAPADDADGTIGRTVLMGVNEGHLATCKVSSNGSCTTNAAAPVAAVMMENPGIQKAILSTVHGYTATQRLVDGPSQGKDFRRGRAAAENIVPSTTGAAKAVARALPELEGKFDGIAFRVPTVTGSIVDFTFLSKRKTSVEEINEIFRKAAKEKRWQGIMRVTEEPIVSSDIIGDPHAAIVDLAYTKVIDNDLVKVLSWYDNEWGYCATLLQHVLKAGKSS